jgi:hypothetical protein
MPKEERASPLLCTFAPFFAEVNALLGHCFAVAKGGTAATRVKESPGHLTHFSLDAHFEVYYFPAI